MRNVIFILISAMVVAACSTEQCRNPRLLHAEAICQHNPDSVIRQLNGLYIDSFTVDADRALYALVFTEAIHRIGLKFSSDTLIDISRRYYEEQGDDKRLARACLHHGIVLYGLKRYGEAFRLIKMAEEMAEQQDNPALCYEVYAVMGDINDNADNHPLTLQYYQRALRSARRIGDKERTARQLNNIATTFDIMGETDSLRKYTELCRPLLDSIERTTRATMLTNMGSYHLQRHETVEAIHCLTQSLETAYLDKTVKLLGDAAYNEGRLEQAADYWFQTLQSQDYALRSDAYRRLINYYDSMAEHDAANHRMASHLSQRLNKLYKENFEYSDASGIIDMQTQYDKQKSERRQYRVVIWLLTVLVIIMLIAAVTAWYYILTHRELVQMRRQEKQQLRNNSRQMKDIMARLQKSASCGRKADDDDITSLMQVSFSLSPTLLSLLKPLTAKEQTICLMIRLHLQPSEIAVLTGSSPQSITNMRVRLLQKLFNENGGAKDFDQRICAVNS